MCVHVCACACVPTHMITDLHVFPWKPTPENILTLHSACFSMVIISWYLWHFILRIFFLQQGGRVKSWKKRWFVLNDNCLYYFKQEKASHTLLVLTSYRLVHKNMADAVISSHCFHTHHWNHTHSRNCHTHLLTSCNDIIASLYTHADVIYNWQSTLVIICHRIPSRWASFRWRTLRCGSSTRTPASSCSSCTIPLRKTPWKPYASPLTIFAYFSFPENFYVIGCCVVCRAYA